MGNRDERRARKRSRAGALISAHLDWLDGYPLDDPSGDVRRWQTVPRDGRLPEIIELTGPKRARALRVARTIFREEREVLERLVPDAERWLRTVELATRGEAPWPLYRTRDAAFIRGERDPFAWLCAARDEIELVRAWVDHRETFETVAERIDLPFALQLCRLTMRLRPAVVLPLLRTFHDPLTHEVSTLRPPAEWARTPPTPIPRGPSALVEPLVRLVRAALAEPARDGDLSALGGVRTQLHPARVERVLDRLRTRAGVGRPRAAHGVRKATCVPCRWRAEARAG